MTNSTKYRDYPRVDATVGQRLVLGFSVAAEPLRRRVPPRLEPHAAPPAAYVALSGREAGKLTGGSNLMLVFNDLLLNQDAQGRTQADASARYVGFNIPSRHPGTGEQGMVHFRIFTGNPAAVPGRYRDALAARVRRECRVIGEGASTTVEEHWEISPETGGVIGLQLRYERGPLVRIVGPEPDFPVWAAAEQSIFRVYQEDTLFEVIRLDVMGINRVAKMRFDITVPELADIFTGEERLVSIFGNPQYARRVFSPQPESAAA
jgi:hypothetical protein